MSRTNLVLRLLDPFAALMLLLSAPALMMAARARWRAPLTRMVQDRIGVGIVGHHYYEPIIHPNDLSKSLDEERNLPGIDLNANAQLELVSHFGYRDELLQIPVEKTAPNQFGYNNGYYGAGDAEILYDIIRHFKPKRLFEIGSGQSTLMARLAIGRNMAERPGYTCYHVCVEPYEQPMLETLGVEVVRKRVEDLGTDFFGPLEDGDILFIDSSHIIRPQGDVLFEYLELLPLLKSGVIVHVHDIFTPRDYPADWVLRSRWLWNEQYLLEAFLSFNAAYQVLLAVNWLSNNHRDKLGDACPVLCSQPEFRPVAFWLRRN
ncbi:MAG: class I SAM-dependent methyltransferase [Rhizomicrobium sp.]